MWGSLHGGFLRGVDGRGGEALFLVYEVGLCKNACRRMVFHRSQMLCRLFGIRQDSEIDFSGLEPYWQGSSAIKTWLPLLGTRIGGHTKSIKASFDSSNMHPI